MSKQAIIQTYQQATPEQISEGKQWYQKAHNFCKEVSLQYDLPLFVTVGCLAALSPQNQWESNMRDLSTIAYAFTSNKSLDSGFKVATFYKNKEKAWNILQTNKVEGHINKATSPKCWSFYTNILEPDNSYEVTIDRHAYAIWKQDETISDKITLSRYVKVAESYRHATGELDISIPSQLQAITWLVWRSKDKK